MKNLSHAALIVSGCAALCVAHASGARADGRRAEQCYSTGETREKIAANEAGEPFSAMRKAAARLEAQAIGVKLCRFGETLLYEVSLLRRDGKVVRCLVDARSGQIVEGETDAK